MSLLNESVLPFIIKLLREKNNERIDYIQDDIKLLNLFIYETNHINENNSIISLKLLHKNLEFNIVSTNEIIFKCKLFFTLKIKNKKSNEELVLNNIQLILFLSSNNKKYYISCKSSKNNTIFNQFENISEKYFLLLMLVFLNFYESKKKYDENFNSELSKSIKSEVYNKLYKQLIKGVFFKYDTTK